MKKILLISLFCVINCYVVSAQIFSQDFSSSTTVSSYVQTSDPSPGQFTFISNYGNAPSSIVNGALRFQKIGGSSSNIVRNVNFSGPPSFLLIKFKFEVSDNVVTETSNHATFFVGRGFINDATAPTDANVHSKFGFLFGAASPGTFRLTNLNTGISSALFSGAQYITFAVNNSDASKIYLAPDGSAESLGNDKWDLWVGTTKVFDDADAQSGSVELNNFKFTMIGTTSYITRATIDFDDFLIYDQSSLPLTVSFNTNGGTEIPSALVPANTHVTPPADPERTGYIFSGWYKDAALTSLWDFAEEVVSESITLYAKWEPITYHVTFNSNGGSGVSPVTAAYNATITEPVPPVRDSYIFGGWYKDAELTAVWDFTTDIVSSDLTLYAKWNDPAQSIHFDAIADRMYGTESFEINATASSGLPVSFEALTSNITINGNVVTITGVGTATIRATQAGNNDYNPATPVEVSFTINKAPQAITFEQAGSFSRYIGSVQLRASSSSGLPVLFEAAEPTVGVVNGNTLEVKGLGQITVTATQPGNELYLPADAVSQVITIHTAGSLQLLVSKALSPNGDGYNDLFVIEGIKNYAENRVKIIDRNGTEVFDSKGYDNSTVVFDGRGKGGDRLPAGTYYYFIEVKSEGQLLNKKGYLVLRY